MQTVPLEYLKSLGYRVYVAGDGEAALGTAASEDHIDVLVTDLKMPRMNGVEPANELTAKVPALKVMFVSGNFDRQFVDSCADKRSSAMLPKPFGLRALASMLRDLLDGKRPQQPNV
jgi:two-component system, cell cycle sensor histidine kinase and response regulator CckA